MVLTKDYTISITKELIAKLPRVQFKGKIRVIDSDETMEEAISTLRQSNILGFDTESKPVFRKGTKTHVSLIQISAGDTCFLFRVRMINNISPLKEILENKDIVKVGLSIHDDFHTLSNNYNFKPKGFIDLQNIVSKHKISNMSLQKLYAILFDERISKSQQLSNWDAVELTSPQMSYAAIDAWACVKIFERLKTFNPDESKYKTPITETE